ncbi:MAG: BirA family transcriptional regulator [Solirubrobacterales bacterium]|jgi:BirA family biotin operon repressor/biotin-[acetyl-CoA-carboxylase] ligase|nr:BirA family transcriptional regulator [Solirubrobacterales bacterium]
MTIFGSPRRHLRSTDSTNARARDLAEAGAPNGTVVTADEQSAGRGRQGRTWFAPPGSALLYSAILRPADPGDRPLLPLAVPLAVAETVETLATVRCEVKWPNDVWIEGRKVAGVLIEGKPGSWAIVGVGLNVAVDEFPEELRETGTSIGGDATVDAALAALNERLSDWIDADADRVRDAFAERDALRGREISWDGGSGVAAGIDDVGHLLVALSGGGAVALGAGEVHLSLA